MRREAVLVMQVEVEVSQRRACGLMEIQRSSCRYQAGGTKTRGYERGCVSWRKRGGDSGTGGWGCCWCAKAGG